MQEWISHRFFIKYSQQIFLDILPCKVPRATTVKRRAATSCPVFLSSSIMESKTLSKEA